jgi:hypothetical protein
MHNLMSYVMEGLIHLFTLNHSYEIQYACSKDKVVVELYLKFTSSLLTFSIIY